MNSNSNRHSNNRRTECSMVTEDPMILLDKFLVDASILESVESQLKKMYPYLLPANDYTWQELLGEDFWADMPDLPIHLAGICLKHLAEQPSAQLTASPFKDGGVTYFQIN